MGLFEMLSGRKKILSFKIVFDEENNVGVATKSAVPNVADVDYVRLWSCYYSKIIYVLGGLENPRAKAALHWLYRISSESPLSETNCFQSTDLGDYATFTHRLPTSENVYSGEFYAKGWKERTIKNNLPRNGYEEQMVFSTFALLQYTIYKLRDKDDVMPIFERVVSNMLELYADGAGGFNAVIQVPTIAYGRAIGIPI
ncbi:MAG: hypothetical protein JNJ70_21820 [Verrucomicrobiales bacterium]|nr:hypothetical protein [Verrucomicrobiales bacterium]